MKGNNMAKCQIRGLQGIAEKDNWNNGCYGKAICKEIPHIFEADSVKNLIKEVNAALMCEDGNQEINPCGDELNRIDFQVYENNKGETVASASNEFQKFKNGEIDLWLCNYSAWVEKVEPVDLMKEYAF